MLNRFLNTLKNNDSIIHGGREFSYRIVPENKTPELMNWCRKNKIIFNTDSNYSLRDQQYEISNKNGVVSIFDMKSCVSALNLISPSDIKMMSDNGVKFLHNNEESLSEACSVAIFRRMFEYIHNKWNLVSIVMEARNGIESIGIFELKDQCSDQIDKLKYVRGIMLKGFMNGKLGMAKVIDTIDGVTLKAP